MRIKIGPMSCCSCEKSVKMHIEAPCKMLRTQEALSKRHLFRRYFELEVDELPYADILNLNGQ